MLYTKMNNNKKMSLEMIILNTPLDFLRAFQVKNLTSLANCFPLQPSHMYCKRFHRLSQAQTDLTKYITQLKVKFTKITLKF